MCLYSRGSFTLHEPRAIAFWALLLVLLPVLSLPKTMPAKKQLPKSVAMAQQRLKQEGKSVSDLKQVLSPKEMNGLATAFRGSLSPDLKQRYDALGSTQAKQESFQQWVMDPEASELSGFQSTRLVVSSMNEGLDRWITVDQLGGPLFLNNKEHAIACSG